MPLINRDNDVSEAQELWSLQANGSGLSLSVVNGSTWLASMVVPRAVQIQSVQATALGVSGSPQILLGALRFNASGAASFVIGTTMALPAFGTSGFLPYSLGAAGGTVLNLQKGDLLAFQQLGGTGAATTNTIVSIVVKNIQDIKTWY
jgi:hypothetical protein